MKSTVQNPCRLPAVRPDGKDYFVDARLQEFRSVSYLPDVIEFIIFASGRGRRMLEQYAAAEGRRCERVTVVQRRSIGSEIECVRCRNCAAAREAEHGGRVRG